jgi:hypothetical protein
MPNPEITNFDTGSLVLETAMREYAEFLAAQINTADQDKRKSDDPPPVNPSDVDASADDQDAQVANYIAERKNRRTVNA